MNKLTSVLIAMAMMVLATSCAENTRKSISIQSPDKNIEVAFFTTSSGQPAYTVSHKNKNVIDTSYLGFTFKNAVDLKENLQITGWNQSSHDSTWTMPWGEKREVRNHYNQLTIQLKEQTENARRVDISFKVYNDGIGFRYIFPEQPDFSEALIMEEHSEFNLTGDHTCWWIPGDWDIYEHLYNTTKFSQIDAISKRAHDDLAQSHIPHNAVNTPVTMRTSDGLHLSFHEADLTDYAGMTLKVLPGELKMKSVLVGSERRDYKVKRKVPFETPWRTIQIAEKAGELIESDLIVNLNDPNKLGDIEWFEPMKYVGIWWEMHLGLSTWDISATQDMSSYKDEESSGKHGATTAHAKELIDFAAENNIGGILVEGWNTGWENWIGTADRAGIFDFVTPYPDYDLQEVVEYGKKRSVQLIMHHETSAAVETYEKQMDTAYKLMEELGIHSVKTGYVGKIIPEGEYHHGQWMVNHYRKALKTAAKHQVAINAHEPIKATGIRRTYPNAISREGLRGQEFNAWAGDGGNPPEHLPIVAFTRMLSGPIDYTPGIFNLKLKPYKEKAQVNSTLAKQLALYVVINSPVQMVPDLIENYIGHPAFEFIREVGVNWQQTKVLEAEVGDYVTIARQERETSHWFVGAITDENSREAQIRFDFLEKGKEYTATIYKDGADAHWDKNPGSYEIIQKPVTSDSKLRISLAAGGGFAISIKPVDE